MSVLKMVVMNYTIRCTECGTEIPSQYSAPLCMRCNGILGIQMDLERFKEGIDWRVGDMGVWRYRALLPISQKTVPVTLDEGGTPLLRSWRLQEKLGLGNLHVKFEGTNPTGSFKDRGMTVGVTHAVELHEENVACASTGNTSASLAAYAARAGLRAVVLVPSGGVALGKLSQAAATGAEILEVEGNFDEALRLLLDLTREPGIYALNSVNPFRIEGQKTVAFEICEQLGRAPENVVLPVGNAGNISAAWKGFLELKNIGAIDSTPRMIGVQAARTSPIVDAVEKRAMKIEAVGRPQTIASAIRIGRPISWKKALLAIYESGGTAVGVSDKEIVQAQSLLAKHEGLFVEPASAAPIAALDHLLQEKVIEEKELTVCIATGHGLKDPETPICKVKFRKIKANVRSLRKHLKAITSPPLGPGSN